MPIGNVKREHDWATAVILERHIAVRARSEGKCGCRRSGHQQPSWERFGGAPGESAFRSGDHATSIGEIVVACPTLSISSMNLLTTTRTARRHLRAGSKELLGDQEATNESDHEHDRGDDVSYWPGLTYAASRGECENRSDCGPGKNQIRKAIRSV